MTTQTRERGIKVLVKRRIWIEDKDAIGGSKPIQPGTVITLSKEQIKKYGVGVTKDLPDGESED